MTDRTAVGAGVGATDEVDDVLNPICVGVAVVDGDGQGMPGTACPSTNSVRHTMKPSHSPNARHVPLAGVDGMAVVDATTTGTVPVVVAAVLAGVHGMGCRAQQHRDHVSAGVASKVWLNASRWGTLGCA